MASCRRLPRDFPRDTNSARQQRDTNSARPQVGGDSSPAIYDAAKDSDWDRVLQLCETNPNCAGYQGPDGSTALHLACSQECPDTAVFETLLQTSPDSVLKEENKGMVPLHYACRFHASDDIVRLMLNLAPEYGRESVSRRDRKGRTPLFYAERGGASSDVVSMLREMNPSARLDDESEAGGPPPTTERHHRDIQVRRDSPPRTEVRKMNPRSRLDDESARGPPLTIERHHRDIQVRRDSPSRTEVRKMNPRSRLDDEYEAGGPPPTIERHHRDNQARMDSRSAVESPPRTEPVDRVSSSYRSSLESRSHLVNPDEPRGSEAKEESGDSEAKEESDDAEGNEETDWTQQGGLLREVSVSGFDNHEILEQFKIMAEHEALLRVKQELGRDSEYEERNIGKPQGVVLVKKNKLLFKTRLPEAKLIPCAGNFAELREPSLQSFRPTPTFCGRTEQMAPEVTPGRLVTGDEEVPMEEQIIQCLGCREKLSCKQKAMMVHCPNCSVDSPAISTST